MPLYKSMLREIEKTKSLNPPEKVEEPHVVPEESTEQSIEDKGLETKNSEAKDSAEKGTEDEKTEVEVPEDKGPGEKPESNAGESVAQLGNGNPATTSVRNGEAVENTPSDPTTTTEKGLNDKTPTETPETSSDAIPVEDSGTNDVISDPTASATAAETSEEPGQMNGNGPVNTEPDQGATPLIVDGVSEAAKEAESGVAAGPPDENPELVSEQQPVDPEPEIPEADKIDVLNLNPEGSFVKQTRRGELEQWLHHMKRVGELWSKETRHGKKWKRLKDLMQKFSEPEVWNSWNVEFRNIDGEPYTNDEITKPNGIATIAQVSASWGLEIYLEHILDDETLNINYDAASIRYKRTALHMARAGYLPDLLKRLMVEKKVNINAEDIDGYYPLHWYILDLLGEQNVDEQKKVAQSVELLLTSGATLTIRIPSNRELPLHLLLSSGQDALVLAALSREDVKDFINIADSYGFTLLHAVWGAAKYTHEKKVEIATKMLEAGADPNTQDVNSAGPLYFASENLVEEGVKLLIKWGANVNDDDVDGRTALYTLADRYPDINTPDSIKIIQILQEAGADLNKRTKAGKSALAAAFLVGNWDTATTLLELHSKEGTDHSYLLQRDINEENMLYCATKLSYGQVGNALQVAKLILDPLTPEEIAPFLESGGSDGTNCFQIAVSRDNQSLTSYLLGIYAQKVLASPGAEDIGVKFLREYTQAILWDCPSVFNENIKTGSWETSYKKLIATKSDSLNFLRTAITTRKPDIIQELADFGVDPLEVDDESWDAWDWAYAFNQQEILKTHFPTAAESVNFDDRKQNWKERFQVPTGWDPKRAHDGLQISDDGLSVSVDSENPYAHKWIGIVANHPIPPYIDEFYFETTLVAAAEEYSPEICIALTVEEPLRERTSWKPCAVGAYGYDANRGYFSTPVDYRTGYGGYAVTNQGTVYTNVGDTIGCGYNPTAKNIFWTKNGEYLGETFTLIEERLIPLFRGSRWFSIRSNFGTDPDAPFLWKGDKTLKYPVPSETGDPGEQAEPTDDDNDKQEQDGEAQDGESGEEPAQEQDTTVKDQEEQPEQPIQTPLNEANSSLDNSKE
ncbi:Ankyrin-2 [Dactylella cylindrospora]|nr:Ankyrin-2 [Dactylella cylindrospora]